MTKNNKNNNVNHITRHQLVTIFASFIRAAFQIRAIDFSKPIKNSTELTSQEKLEAVFILAAFIFFKQIAQALGLDFFRLQTLLFQEAKDITDSEKRLLNTYTEKLLFIYQTKERELTNSIVDFQTEAFDTITGINLSSEVYTSAINCIKEYKKELASNSSADNSRIRNAAPLKIIDSETLQATINAIQGSLLKEEKTLSEAQHEEKIITQKTELTLKLLETQEEAVKRDLTALKTEQGVWETFYNKKIQELNKEIKNEEVKIQQLSKSANWLGKILTSEKNGFIKQAFSVEPKKASFLQKLTRKFLTPLLPKQDKDLPARRQALIANKEALSASKKQLEKEKSSLRDKSRWIGKYTPAELEQQVKELEERKKAVSEHQATVAAKVKATSASISAINEKLSLLKTAQKNMQTLNNNASDLNRQIKLLIERQHRTTQKGASQTNHDEFYRTAKFLLPKDTIQNNTSWKSFNGSHLNSTFKKNIDSDLKRIYNISDKMLSVLKQFCDTNNLFAFPKDLILSSAQNDKIIKRLSNELIIEEDYDITFYQEGGNRLLKLSDDGKNLLLECSYSFIRKETKDENITTIIEATAKIQFLIEETVEDIMINIIAYENNFPEQLKQLEQKFPNQSSVDLRYKSGICTCLIAGTPPATPPISTSFGATPPALKAR